MVIEKKSTEKEKDNPSLVQPKMRFKPRTDLERIVEAVNTQSFGRVRPAILYKHLKELELNIVKKNTIEENRLLEETMEKTIKRNKVKKKDLEDDEDEENQSEKSLSEKKLDKSEPNKKRRLFTKRQKANIEAKNVMSDLHTKTHFKAATVFSIKGKSRNNENVQPEEKEKKTLNKVKSHLNLFDNYRTKFNININPLKITEHLNEENKEKLKFLKTISSLPFLFHKANEYNKDSPRKKSVFFVNSLVSPSENDSINEINKRSSSQIEDRLSNDNELYNKQDIQVVAKKILTKCNYIPDLKTKYKN